MPENDENPRPPVIAPDFKVIYTNQIHTGFSQSDYQLTCFVVTGDEQGPLSIRQAVVIMTHDVRRRLTKSLIEYEAMQGPEESEVVS